MGNRSSRSTPSHSAPTLNYDSGLIKFNVAVLGAAQTGKSSLVYWKFKKELPPKEFLDEKFFEDYNIYFECDSHHHQLTVNDTSSQAECTSILDQYIRGAKTFVLIFDITNQASFTAIDDFKDQILRVKDEDRYPMVLVGSRADKQGERVVSFADANKYAMSIGTTYLEVDLTNGTGVDEVFSESARKVAQFNRPPAAYKKPAPKK